MQAACVDGVLQVKRAYPSVGAVHKSHEKQMSRLSATLVTRALLLPPTPCNCGVRLARVCALRCVRDRGCQLPWPPCAFEKGVAAGSSAGDVLFLILFSLFDGKGLQRHPFGSRPLISAKSLSFPESLHHLSRMLARESTRVPFLRSERPLWPHSTCQVIQIPCVHALTSWR